MKTSEKILIAKEIMSNYIVGNTLSDIKDINNIIMECFNNSLLEEINIKSTIHQYEMLVETSKSLPIPLT